MNSNSIIDQKEFSHKKILVIVPHQDDEINVVGSLLPYMKKNENECYILFTTNGNMYGQGKIRKEEAKESCQRLGINPENLIFLEYCDQCRGQCVHNFQKEEIRTEWKRKIKEIIKKIRPEIIFCVDLDVHPDHMATSILSEEAIGEILKEDGRYKPAVLKGFAYSTAYNAKYDFYHRNIYSTRKPFSFGKKKLDNPLYVWEERVRVPICEYHGMNIQKYTVYKALEAHKTQNAVDHAPMIINSDMVFWRRRTDSLSYDSTIVTSSGEEKYLNDFSLLSIKNIMSRRRQFYTPCWIPDELDEDKCFRMEFHGEKTIDHIVLYENMNKKAHIKKAKITFSNGYFVEIRNIDSCGKKTKIFFPQQKVSYVKFEIIESVGKDAGIAEFQVYEAKEDRLLYLKIMKKGHFIYRYETPFENCKFTVYGFYSVSGSRKLSDKEVEVTRIREGRNCFIKVNDRENPAICDKIQLVKVDWKDFIATGLQCFKKRVFGAVAWQIKKNWKRYSNCFRVVYGMVFRRK